MLAHPLFVGKRFLLGMIGVVMILSSLSACSQASTQRPITIGYSVSLTGSFSADGHALQQGYQLWANMVNQNSGLLGRPVKLKWLDDGSLPARVKANYQTLIQKDHVDLLLGPFSTLLAVQAAKVTNQHHVALFAPTGNAPSMFKLHDNNVFVITLPSQQNLESFALFTLSLPQSMRPQTAAYVSANSPFTTPQVDAARKIMGDNIQTVYAPDPYPANANIASIAKQIAQSNADVVILGTSGLIDCVSFIKAFKQLNYNPKELVATSGPDEGAQFMNAVGAGSTEGVFISNSGWYPGETTYQSDQFAQAYIGMYHGNVQDISATTAEAFSAGQLLQQAVTQAQSLNNAKLIQVVHSGTFNTIQGPLKFDESGANTIGIPNLFQWIQGKPVLVYPATNAQANPEYPKSKWS